MPLPLIPLIAAGAGIAGQAINAVTTSGQNRRSQQFARERYDVERRDALADWERINSYNHPTQQMQRLKEAGLNPHLVYGGGTTTTSANIGSTKTQSADFRPAQFDPQGIVMGYAQAEALQANIDNTREAIKTAQEQQRLINANTYKALADVDTKNFTLEQKKRHADLLFAQQELRTLQAEENLTGSQDANQRRIDAFPLQMDKLRSDIERNDQSVQESLIRIEKMRMDMSKTAWEKKLIAENIRRLQNYNYIQDMSKEDQIDTKRALAKLTDLKTTEQEFDNQIKAAEATFKKAGLSPTLISDILNSIISLRKRR